MGVFTQGTGPFGEFTVKPFTPVIILAAFASFLGLAVVLNVLKQLLFKNSNEPPLVFHWFPILGSTVTYGIDPYSFFFANRAKVSNAPLCWA